MPPEDPGSPDRDLAKILHKHIREELRNFHTAAIGILETIDHDDMTATVALKHEPGAKLPNVPIAVPFATDGTGDVPPLRPEDDPEGLVIFTDMPLDTGLLADRGPRDVATGEPSRVDDAIWLPAMLWYDTDATPNHDGDAAERTFTHPDGPELRIHGGRTLLAHGGRNREGDQRTVTPPGSFGDPDTRVRLRLTDDPYGSTDIGTDQPLWPGGGTRYQTRDSPAHGYDEHQLWPRAYGSAAALEHPSGTHVTVTEQGVGVAANTTPDGTRQRGLYCGAVSDPDRIPVRHHRHELRGVPQPVTDEDVRASGDGTTTVTLAHTLGERPGHVDVTPRNAAARGVFHVDAKTADDVTVAYESAPPEGSDNLVYDVCATPPRDADEDVALTTEPLTHREQTARLTDGQQAAAVLNADHGDVQAAQRRAQNHRAYLALYAGTELDPTDPDAWPTVEHVPETAEWAAFDDADYDPLTFESDTPNTHVSIDDRGTYTDTDTE